MDQKTMKNVRLFLIFAALVIGTVFIVVRQGDHPGDFLPAPAGNGGGGAATDGRQHEREVEKETIRAPSSFSSSKRKQPTAPTTVIELDFSSREFATAWKTSSKRETSSVPLRWTESGKEDIKQQQSTKQLESRVTFYGKSSLKIKYTARRSIEVELAEGDGIQLFDYESDGQSSRSLHRIKRFVLLSLWEDTYRIAYRTSAVLLRQLGLFYPVSSLVELRCTGQYSAEVCSDSGSTLGIYLAIEYPSDAIKRVVSAAPEQIPAVKCAVSQSAQDGHRKEAAEGEGEEVTAAAEVQIATRNWFYFEKPAVYDMLSVPSYKRDSPLSPLYRAVEKDPLKAESELNFNLDQYLAWLVVNTALKNGDYDDEVFFWSRSSNNSNKKKKGGSANAAVDRVGIMAWDYDNIFAPCHRKGKRAIKSKIMFCAETPLEAAVHNIPALRKRYEKMAQCLLNGPLSNAAFSAALSSVVHEFESIVVNSKSKPNAVLRATWFDAKQKQSASARVPDVQKGAAHLRGEFLSSRKELLEAVGGHEEHQPAKEEIKKNDSVEQHQQEGEADTSHKSKSDPACSSAAAEKALRAIVKSEYKVKMPFSSGDEFLEAIKSSKPQLEAGGTARMVSNFGIGAKTVEGTHCVVWDPPSSRKTSDGRKCPAVARAFVVRSAERGKAEFGVSHFLPPSLLSLLRAASQNNQNHGGGKLTGNSNNNGGKPELDISAPEVWPEAAASFPVILQHFFLAAANKNKNRNNNNNDENDSNAAAPAWNRDIEVDSVKVHHGGDQNIALIRGFGSFFVAIKGASDEASASFPSYLAASDLSGGKSSLIQLSNSVAAAQHPMPTLINRVEAAEFPELPAIVQDGSVFTCNRKEEGAGLGGSSKTEDERRKQQICACRVPSSGVVVQKNAKLVVEEGCLLMMMSSSSSASSSIKVLDGGQLILRGSAQRRVSIAAATTSNSFWSPITCSGSNARVDISHTIVSGSGVERSSAGIKSSPWHHHSHTAAIIALDGCKVHVYRSFFVGLRGPAFAASTQASIHVEGSLVQFAELGIECVSCDFVSRNSAWTHFASFKHHEKNVFARSLLANEEAGEQKQTYEDSDNDAMYLSGGKHEVIGSVIARTHDDGIDSGTPEHLAGAALSSSPGGGALLVEDTFIEDVTHEGIAFSSGAAAAVRRAVVRKSQIQRAQQCVEMGYSGPGCEATIQETVLQRCHVGVRYGDNYRRPVEGRLSCEARCTLRENDVNVLNLVRKQSGNRDDHREPNPRLVVSRDSMLGQDRVGKDFACTSLLESFSRDAEK